ncbi:MAG: hypothetical protein U9N49_02220 [Campylobacterota bacterium]|nr:hypothetical protein [Campylobacterota bacterium]
MTTLLEDAFEKVSQLSNIEQNRYAHFILEEIEAEQKWDKLLGESEILLESMADEALHEFEKSQTTPLEIK